MPWLNFQIHEECLFPTQHCHAYFYGDDTILYAIGVTAYLAFSRLQTVCNDFKACFKLQLLKN